MAYVIWKKSIKRQLATRNSHIYMIGTMFLARTKDHAHITWFQITTLLRPQYRELKLGRRQQQPTTPENNDLVGWTSKNNRAARAARTSEKWQRDMTTLIFCGFDEKLSEWQ